MFKRFSYGSLSLCFSLSVLLLSGCGGASSGGDGTITGGTSKVELGRKLFRDEDLSSEGNQSCASCHDLDDSANSGFADPDPAVTTADPVSEGSVAGRFGNRNAPTAAYASFSPEFELLPVGERQEQAEETPSKYRGGQFLDGRASDLVEQAKGPFLNPVEMNNVDAEDVVAKVKASTKHNYVADFLALYNDHLDDTATAYNNIADAIAAFEASKELNPFTSKFDAKLAGLLVPTDPWTDSEQRGLELFMGDAKCANCHTLDETGAARSLFTNFKYYNVGTPANPDNPADPAIDEGLGGLDEFGEAANQSVDPADIAAGTERGKFRVSTLRNIELTAPYMHNGVYETLEEVIRHYDTFGGEGIEAEVGGFFNSANNIANELLDELNQNGLGLDSTEINPPAVTSNDYTDLEAFLLTLTDGYF
ncbi:MAG: hypothetical protein L3J28_04990 [Candidatus Polarisedimenticolaceae bacterium]|nr:hypothetical protein [Candidatus Polarisedimenticolaceae bacterium]